MIRGVLFDMDGVILDTEREGRVYFLEQSARRGYPMDHATFATLLGRSTDGCRVLLKEIYGPEYPYDEVYAAYREDLLRQTYAGQMPVKRGMSECMAGLKARGIRIALVTSTPRYTVDVYLQTIPQMQNVFDVMVCGGEVAHGKPAPDAYLEAAKRLGLPIEECIGVEDSRMGLQSLKAAGCTSVMIPDILPNDETFAGLVSYELEHLGQLCGLIDRVNLGAKAKA